MSSSASRIIREPGPHQRLVIGQHDPDHPVRPGTGAAHCARTVNPPPGPGPPRTSPPVDTDRSRMPADAHARAARGLRRGRARRRSTSTQQRCRPAPLTSRTRAVPAVSGASRWSATPARCGTRRCRSRRDRLDRAAMLSVDGQARTRPWTSASRGISPGARGPGPRSARSPSSRSSGQHGRQLVEHVAAGPLDDGERLPAASGRRSSTWAAAPAWTLMVAIACATLSCRSRAIRSRSSATRRRASSSRVRSRYRARSSQPGQVAAPAAQRFADEYRRGRPADEDERLRQAVASGEVPRPR